MEEHCVVPDVVDSVPKYVIEVKYPSGVQLNMGNELTPTSVKDVPQVKWPLEPKTLYTLAMVDPDAPTRDKQSTGQSNTGCIGIDIAKGELLAEYAGSGAPKDSGFHRYVFLVYKQQYRIENTETSISNRDVRGRYQFQIREFAQKYSLGQPIAANFFRAQWDDYVPILQEQVYSTYDPRITANKDS